MAKTQKEFLIAWLNDAHAMEKALMKVLDNHIKDAKDHPQMQQKLQEHHDLAQSQADRLEGCIERLGGSTSMMKDGMGNIMGMLQGISTGAAKDELVKNVLADYAAEHFEIASYRALIAAAEKVGDMETVQVCRQILREEEEMARWLEQHLPMVVQDTLRTEAEQQRAA
jgi:ferritin-like metal-binding protein YciE